MNTAAIQRSSANNTSLIEQLFDAGAHFGFSRSRRHPSFRDIIFNTKNKVDIINLEKTAQALAEAQSFTTSESAKGAVMLMVGTKPEARSAIQKNAKAIGAPYVIERWVGGTLTNFPQIRKRIERLAHLREQKEKGQFEGYTKKERLDIDREIEEMTARFGGISELSRLPDIVFVVDPRHEHTAVAEAHKLSVPVIALAGSDCNIGSIAYPIPANDATVASITFFVEKIASAFEKGRAAAEKEGVEKKEKENSASRG